MSRAPALHTGSLWRVFLRFLLPLMAQNILQSLSMTISAIVVGRTLGTPALAAVATFFPVAFFFLAFLIGLSAGASVLVGQAFGAGKTDTVRKVAGTTLAVALASGLVLALLGEALAGRIMAWLGTPADIMADAVLYARASFLTMPALFLFITGASLLRGLRDTMRPLMVQVVATLVSTVLTWVLVTRTPLGVAGAAFAQGTAQLAGFLFLGLWLRRLGHPLAPGAALLKAMRPDLGLLRTILRVGLPTGVQVVVGSMAGLVIIGLVNGFGSDATAAYGAVGQVQNYVQFPALSIAIAASIFGAQMIGARQAHRIGDVLRTALLMNLLLTGSLVALVFLFARPVVSAFITEPEVVDLAEYLLHIVTWSSLMFGAGTIFSGLMRASGTVLVPMLISVFSVVGVELPVAIWLSGRIGLPGIWWGYVAGFGALMVMQGAYYMLVWRRKAIVALV